MQKGIPPGRFMAPEQVRQEQSTSLKDPQEVSALPKLRARPEPVASAPLGRPAGVGPVRPLGILEFPLSLGTLELPLSFRIVELPLSFGVVELPLSFGVVELPLSSGIVELPLSFEL